MALLARLVPQQMRKIWRYTRAHWKFLMGVAALGIITTLLSLVSPYLYKMMIDNALLGKNFQLMIILIVAEIGIFLLSRMISVASIYFNEEFTQEVSKDIKQVAFKHAQTQHMGFFHKYKTGDILSRVDDDAVAVPRYVLSSLGGLNTVILAVSTTIICLTFNWQLTAATLLFFPIYLIAEKQYEKREEKFWSLNWKHRVGIWNFLWEKMGKEPIKLARLFSREAAEAREYSYRTKNLIRMAVKQRHLTAFWGTVLGFITYLPNIVVFGYGGYQVIIGNLTIGGYTAMAAYMAGLFYPLSRLADLKKDLKKTMVDANRVFSFLGKRPAIKEKPDAVDLKDVKGEIRFKNVTFGYEPRKLVLKNVSFIVKPGEKVALVGLSGSGKSTTADLIGRFYDPNSGSITLDGHDLRDLALNSIYGNIGVVAQQTILFNCSIRENIKYGKSDATDAEMIQVAKLANIHDAIMAMPERYDTIIGKKGLSGGEKQRISIARTILKNPKILILDEATSSLDAKNERLIQEALDRITKDKTVLIIAHRFSTIRNVDKIIVMDKGKIVESGTFTDLVKKKGVFYDLYKTQFGHFEEFQLKLVDELKKARQMGYPLTLATLDMDKLDYYITSAEGVEESKLIKEVERVIAANMKKEYLLAKVPHGAFFFIAMPKATKVQAAEELEILKRKLEEEMAVDLGFSHDVSTSARNLIEKSVALAEFFEYV